MKKRLFIIIEFLIYCTFIILDLNNIDSTYIKYFGVLLCFLNAILNNQTHIKVALFFTCLADLFLLVLDKHYTLGVFIFIFAQSTYFYYLSIVDESNFQTFMGLRLLIIILGILVLFLIKQLEILYIFVLIYFSTLILNCLYSYKAKRYLMALGFALFICCDICVGLHNLSCNNELVTFLMWVFYLPSQVILSFS